MNTETAILQLMNVRGFGRRSLYKLLTRLINEQHSVSDFVNAPSSLLIEEYGFKPEIVESLQNARDLAEALYDELGRHSIQLLTIGTEAYPKSITSTLGDTTPPVLFAAGNLSLLDKKAVGFCGSRKASEESCRLVGQCASLFAQQGYNIVSGYAFGVDLAAHQAALRDGGVTTFVLATGVLHFSAKNTISDLLNDDNFLVISEFSPRLPWTVHNAMQRNRTIIALSQVMILAEAGAQGGTFEAGKAALQLQKPLYVLDSLESENLPEGSRLLLQRGANALRSNRDGKPDLGEVIKLVNSVIPTPGQISFL